MIDAFRWSVINYNRDMLNWRRSGSAREIQGCVLEAAEPRGPGAIYSLALGLYVQLNVRLKTPCNGCD